MQREELLTDPRFKNQVVRAEQRAAIDDIVAAWTAQYELAELLPLLEAATIPAGPVYSIGDIVKDPHFQARDMLLSLHDRVLGELKVPGIVPKLSETPGEVRWLGPEIGAHNEEVYSGLLHFSPDQIAALEARGAI
jgi:crotonobetainyl-CoA:carnitine CoA-transferase CaiB-like acyl-CoA transferase